MATDDDAPDLEAAPDWEAALDASALEGFEFHINPDGSVTFVDFPPELLEIAYALNPDDPLVCERMELAGRAGTQDEGEGD